jgi:phosphohistidine phosphatase
MRVVLFRHGPAGSRDPAHWPDDRLRPLTQRGEARTAAAARGLRRLEPEVAAVVTSPLARAARTAKLVGEVYGGAPQETLEALAPGGSYRRVVEFLSKRGRDETLVLVGHEPDLGKLAGMLVFGAPAALPLKKAGACAVDFTSVPQAGKGRLAWLLPPRVLRRLARRKEPS